jgi:type I restriction enzyme S subunit
MNAETFCEHFATFADAPNGIAKLREFILQLAVQGKLVPQDVSNAQAGNPQCDDKRKECRNAETTVSDFAEIQNGYAFKSQWFVQDGVRLVRNVNVGHDELRWDEAACVTPEIAKQFDRFNLAEGDIVISLDRPLITTGLKVARVGRDDIPCLLLQRVGRVVFTHKDVLPEYFFLWLHSPAFTKTIDPGRSNGVPHISAREIEAIPFSLPPLAEQRRIVEKVDQLLGLCDELAARQAAQREKRQRLVGATLDRLVSTRNPAEFPTHAHRLRNHFDQLFDTPTTIPQLRQTILQLAVQGQLVPQDPNDEPAECLRQRLVVFAMELQESGRTSRRKPLPEIDESDVPFVLPEQWAWVRFGELAAEVEYGTSQKASEIGGDVPVLRMNAIRDGRVVLEESKFVASTIKDLPKLYLKNGDILFNRTNSYELVGKSGVFYGPDNKFTFASYLIRGSLLPELLPEFITIAMNAKYYRTTQIEPEVTQQCGQANFNGTKLQHSLIPLPPLAEQRRIVTKVTELLSLCDALEAKLTQAESASTQLLSAAVHHLLTSTIYG